MLCGLCFVSVVPVDLDLLSFVCFLLITLSLGQPFMSLSSLTFALLLAGLSFGLCKSLVLFGKAECIPDLCISGKKRKKSSWLSGRVVWLGLPKWRCPTSSGWMDISPATIGCVAGNPLLRKSSLCASMFSWCSNLNCWSR